MKVVYTPHHRAHAEGSLYLDKEGACTMTLTGAASMPQSELDLYGRICAAALVHADGKIGTNALDAYDNHQLLEELRRRGLVVCAFSAEDVISGQCPDEMENPSFELQTAADEWLDTHSEQLESAMTEAGNHVIGFAPDPIGQQEDG